MVTTGLDLASAVASGIQLTEFGIKVCNRINEFRSDTQEVPKTFLQFSHELPLIQETLRKIQEDAKDEHFSEKTRKVLTPAVVGCMEHLHSCNTIVEKSLPGSGESRGVKTWKAIVSLKNDSKLEKEMKIIRKYTNTIAFYLIAALKNSNLRLDEQWSSIRHWLRAPDPSPYLEKASQQSLPGSGSWLLQSDQFSKWKADAPSSLWLHGIPGCGKTIISSTIICDLTELRRHDIGCAVAYFYFDFADPTTTDSKLMIYSLIVQLSQQAVQPPTGLDELYQASMKAAQRPLISSALVLLKEIIKGIPQVYIVLDALDECTDRQELLVAVKAIADGSCENLHILLTSRTEKNIEDSIKQYIGRTEMICLESDLVGMDIQAYIQRRLLQDVKFEKWRKDVQIMKQIEYTLGQRAQGMFRWVACQLDALQKCRHRKSLLQSLDILPPTLDDTYDRILCAIAEDDVDYAIRILSWIVVAVRPLHVAEIAEVLAIDLARTPAFDSDEVLQDPLDILEICSSLVTIVDDRQGECFVCMAHFSVMEYLLSDRPRRSLGSASRFAIDVDTCHELVARSCVSYLLQFAEAGSLESVERRDSKLARYAAKHWMFHAEMAQRGTDALDDTIMGLFRIENEAYYNWIRIYDLDIPHQPFSPLRKRNTIALPLYYASRLGLEGVARKLIEEGANVDARGGSYGHALNVASSRNEVVVIELLIRSGANLDAPGVYGNSLHTASIRGHIRVVKLLLKNGANVNGNERYFNPLDAAGTAGHSLIVDILHEAGARSNSATIRRASSNESRSRASTVLPGANSDIPNEPEGSEISRDAQSIRVSGFFRHSGVLKDGIRVPCLAIGPGFPEGCRCSDRVMSRAPNLIKPSQNSP